MSFFCNLGMFKTVSENIFNTWPEMCKDCEKFGPKFANFDIFS